VDFGRIGPALVPFFSRLPYSTGSSEETIASTNGHSSCLGFYCIYAPLLPSFISRVPCRSGRSIMRSPESPPPVEDLCILSVRTAILTLDHLRGSTDYPYCRSLPRLVVFLDPLRKFFHAAPSQSYFENWFLLSSAPNCLNLDYSRFSCQDPFVIDH